MNYLKDKVLYLSFGEFIIHKNICLYNTEHHSIKPIDNFYRITDAIKMILISDIDYHDSKIKSIIHLFGGNYASCSGNKIIIRDNTFSPIQTFNKDNNKNINCLIQTLNGILCSGGDDFNIQLYE